MYEKSIGNLRTCIEIEQGRVGRYEESIEECTNTLNELVVRRKESLERISELLSGIQALQAAELEQNAKAGADLVNAVAGAKGVEVG